MIKYTQKQLEQIRVEGRKLRQRIAIVTNAWLKQKAKAEKLEKENKKLQKENKALKDDQEKLNQKLKNLKDRNDKLRGRMFKANKKIFEKDGSYRKRGAQKGHKPHHRKTPKKIDLEKEVYLTHCPECNNPVKQTQYYKVKIVEDLPKQQKAITIKYKIQRQWCPKCKKEVSAVPIGTIEKSNFGTNLIIWILYQKYRQRTPINRIQEALKEQYQFKISQGGIQEILHQVKRRFKGKYQEILEEIRKGKVKHADETGWRNQGQNNWVWLFANEKAVYYTIEETRGKKVPEKIIGDDPDSVLVRDDYGGYTNLNIKQQSCWTHLLRNSHDAVKQDDASNEVKILHSELKDIFVRLKLIVDRPFDISEREGLFEYFQERIKAIIDQRYTAQDALKIQTRIRNQNDRLLTALRFEGVALTNNFAERCIRPLTVIRKISGGSRSDEGAVTTAVNMSVIQTLALESRPFFDSLSFLLSLNRFALSTGGE